MRISTSQIYALGGSSSQRQQSAIFRLQDQISSGRRVNVPSDDPLAAARVLEIGQSQSVNEQLSVNADYATSALQAQESALTGITDILAQLRTQGVYAGNPSLGQTDRQVLAADFKSKLAEILSLANTQDNGQYLFSGFQGAVQPFSEISPGVVNYNGDEGRRLIQITQSRQVPVSAAGVEVFQRIRNGNGTFAISADPTVTGVTNTGTGVATPGILLDPTAFANPANSRDLYVNFSVDNTVSPPVTTYDIVDNASGNSLLTGAPASPTGPFLRTYTSGTAISFKTVAPPDTNPTPFDFGAEFSISGSPATGDRFTLKASVNNQDIFSTINGIINALEHDSGAQLSNKVATFLQDLSQAEESFATSVTSIGTTLNEVDTSKNNVDGLVIQNKVTISQLQDLDLAQASTDLSFRTTQLQAAFQSFLRVQGLSLFNFLQ